MAGVKESQMADEMVEAMAEAMAGVKEFRMVEVMVDG